MKNTNVIDGSLKLPAGFLAIAMLGLAIAGAVLNYSPAPHWDMWDTIVWSVFRIQEGDYSFLWAQHNEHRIFLGRIIFWIDYKIFGGLNIFLVILNYLLIGIASYIFWLHARRICIEQSINIEKAYGLILFIIACLFLWTQEENLISGSQSLFFLVHLLPLVALYWLSKSSESSSWLDFSVACIFAALSVGTLANGTLVFPLMFIYSLVMRQGLIKSTLLLIFSIAVMSLYFHDYRTPGHHPSLSDTIINDPVGMVHYTAHYLGSPFYYLFGRGVYAEAAATLLGGIFIAVSVLISYRQIFTDRKSAVVLALVFFVAYIGGTAFGTSGGRLGFEGDGLSGALGLEQAFSSRYTTPAIMGWVALMLTIFGSFADLIGKAKNLLVFLFSSISVLMLGYQFNALENRDHVISKRELTMLALELGIKDSNFIESTFWSYDFLLKIVAGAKTHGISVFGTYPYLNLKQKLGSYYEFTGTSVCLGNLEGVEPIEGVTDYARVSGWLFDSKTESSPKLIKFIDQRGIIVGFALTGTPREDLKRIMHRKAGLSGFRGYVQRSVAAPPLKAIGDNQNCLLDFSRLR